MVIGIAGGLVRHDNRVHGVVQFADWLRHDFPEGVYVEVFENHRRQQAREEIERRLDTDPAHTKILGNVRREYKSSSCPGYLWYNRWFTVPHCAIEIDPEVWNQAETFIRSALRTGMTVDAPLPSK